MILLGVAVRWLQLAAGLCLIGIFTVRLLAGRGDRPTVRSWEARLGRWTPGLVALALLSGLAALAYQSAVATGRPTAALEPAVWMRLLLQSQFGTVWLIRHAFLILLAALVVLRDREQSAADWAAFCAKAGASASAGHV